MHYTATDELAQTALPKLGASSYRDPYSTPNHTMGTRVRATNERQSLHVLGQMDGSTIWGSCSSPTALGPYSRAPDF